MAALDLSLLFSRLGGELRALFGALGSTMDSNGSPSRLSSPTPGSTPQSDLGSSMDPDGAK